MRKKLLTDETIAAYTARFQSMVDHGFTEEGNDLFIEKLVAVSEQVNNLHVRTKIGDVTIDNDEPKSLGGTNLAPRPMETLLAALSNCLEISALLYFSFSNMDVKSVKVKVEATFDKRAVLMKEEAPLPGFHDISYTWYIETEENLRKVEQVLQKVARNCPVKGTFSLTHEFPQTIKII